MQNEKHLYETTFIVNASLEDPQVEAVITRVQEIITKNGGDVNAINRWGRKRLAYIIKKKNNGYYVNIEINAFGPIVKQLEHFYLLEESIIRFLTIRLDKKALKARELGALKIQAAEELTPAIEVPTEKVPLFGEELIEPKS